LRAREKAKARNAGIWQASMARQLAGFVRSGDRPGSGVDGGGSMAFGPSGMRIGGMLRDPE
jgi:hypothetical protein